MPNWVYNHLSFTGDEKEIERLVKQVGAPYEVPVRDMDNGDRLDKCTNPIFAFWNIVKPDDLVSYMGQPQRSTLNPNQEGWWQEQERLLKVGKDWYSWNITNWGTKWDVAKSDNEKYSDTCYDEKEKTFRFNTAWSVPIDVLNTLSSQYPTIQLHLSYEEEGGWGGEIIFTNGEHVIIREYAIECRECDNDGADEEEWYCEGCEGHVCPECGYVDNMDNERCDKHKEQEEVNA
jgi:hypothetical protein